jgi:hypothetical protein
MDGQTLDREKAGIREQCWVLSEHFTGSFGQLPKTVIDKESQGIILSRLQVPGIPEIRPERGKCGN